MEVPYFRPSIGQAEIDAVAAVLRSGWLTTGSRCREFEAAFRAAVDAPHAVALNSCTAALHLALDAVGVRPGDMVLVPALTFAATAEVVLALHATPVFVDVDPVTLCLDPEAAAEALSAIAAGREVCGLKPPYGPARALVPVHYGGVVGDVLRLRRLASEHGLAVVEDCAHAFPAQWRENASSPWRAAGDGADVACFSFYANKTITTGEGGMATTARAELADRMRTASLHGMSHDAFSRFETGGSWDYAVVAAGYKYNLTDIAAALGLVQLGRADELLGRRRTLAAAYAERLAGIDLDLPVEPPNRRSSWHLYPVRMEADRRDGVIEQLRQGGIGTSVHWRPLPLQPLYRDRFGYLAEHCPVAVREWRRLVSLPLFPDMTEPEQDHVVAGLRAALGR